MSTKQIGRPKDDSAQKARLKAVQTEIASLIAVPRQKRSADQLRRLDWLRKLKSRVVKRLRTGFWQ